MGLAARGELGWCGGWGKQGTGEVVGRVSKTRVGREETLQGTGLPRERPLLCGNNHLESWLPGAQQGLRHCVARTAHKSGSLGNLPIEIV